MYRRLTVGYKTLSHAKNTPLSMNWEAEPGHEVVEDDATIATLYPQVQAAYEEFCKLPRAFMVSLHFTD